MPLIREVRRIPARGDRPCGGCGNRSPKGNAAGQFTHADGILVNNIARWDGIGWSALAGPSSTGMDASVTALAVFNDGTGDALYAGGHFVTAGGVTVNRVARWDGASWSVLSGPSEIGFNNYVRALSVYDDGSGDALYAGGYFGTAGGVTVNRIARWDGNSWSDLSGPSGTGVTATVAALDVYDDGSGDALYAAGQFAFAGGVTVNGIATWDGASWSDLSGPSGTGLNSWVEALTVFNDGSGDALFVGGQFSTAGGLASWKMAKWRCDIPFFSDGFESGGTAAWSNTVP